MIKHQFVYVRLISIVHRTDANSHIGQRPIGYHTGTYYIESRCTGTRGRGGRGGEGEVEGGIERVGAREEREAYLIGSSDKTLILAVESLLSRSIERQG